MPESPAKPYRTGQDALTSGEATLLLEKTATNLDRALIRFTIATGMRREDVVKVELKDLDLQRRKVRYIEKKKKNRVWEADFDQATADDMARYVDSLPRGTRWLFPSPRDPSKHIDDKTAYNRLQASLDRAGLRRRPFHALRSTFIKLSRKAGWTDEQIQRQTGDSFRVIQAHYMTPSDDEMSQVAKDKPLL